MIKCTQEDWQALGLEPGASLQSIKRAFRRRVKQCHPDVCVGDETSTARLKELMRAYERITASTEAAARVNSLFKSTPPAAIPARCPAGASAPMDRWLIRNFIEQANQSLQLVMLLALLISPFVTLALGGAAVRPALERYVERHAVIRSHGKETDERLEYLRAAVLSRQMPSASHPAAGLPGSVPSAPGR